MINALVYESFGTLPKLQTIPDPKPASHGAIIKVEATGLCRSDWHGWVGHEAVIELPHVPGHEFAGVVSEVGRDVTRWKVGQRVTIPFVGGCGSCADCTQGHQHICGRASLPGFTHWGSFAEYVAIDQADTNLVELPEDMDFATAASLGCRFATSFRAVVDQGRVGAGEWVVVHGCGGIGLSAIMIARALGANVIAVDLTQDKLELAKSVGAVVAVNAQETENVPKAIRQITGGGAHVSIEAIGHPQAVKNSILGLRKRGRHVQIGLLEGNSADGVPLRSLIFNELEVIGSFGMQAHRYDGMMRMIQSGQLAPSKLIAKTIALGDAPQALADMGKMEGAGVTVITDFA